MSDGITEARKGTYWDNNKYKTSPSRFSIPEIDPQTGERNPYYEELTGKKVKFDTEFTTYMPNQKWHRYVSFAKSAVRIAGFILLPFNLVSATIVLILSEIIGIVEELV